MVVAKRQMIAQTKKANAMKQGIVKQQKHNDNKRQVRLEDHYKCIIILLVDRYKIALLMYYSG